MNLFSTLESHAKRDPGKTAIVCGEQRTSYSDLLEEVNRMACGLDRMGLKKGDRIALMMHNCPEFITVFYAAMKLGLISVSLNVMFKRDEADFIVKDAGPKVLIAHPVYFPVISGVEDVREGRFPVLWLAPPADSSTDPMLLDVLIREADGSPPSPGIGPEDEAVIAYTSGTTGFPKGAVHTHGNICAHLEGIRGHLDFGSGDTFLAVLPFFQLVAFLIHPGMAFHAGGTVVLLEKFEPEPFLEAVKQERVTFFAAVPTIYNMLHAYGEKEADMETVRFGICAGSPLSLDLRASFEKRFSLRIVHCYGMTEISLIAACEDPASAPEGITVGHVMSYLRLRIVGEDGLPAGAAEVGEIQIGAEKALKRYWNRPEESAEALRDGWFATGDMGRMDEQGLLSIVDRKKDMVIRGGFNVFPAEIERVLLQDPRVAEAAVIGVPHERLGEVPKAFVALREGVEASEKEILEEACGRLAAFKAPEEVEIVDPGFFPRNALGKIVKPRLKG